MCGWGGGGGVGGGWVWGGEMGAALSKKKGASK